jgi:ABC-type branched-subunit amino acid transport system substrate-binding protein
MRRAAVLTCVAALVGGLLAGCAGSSTEDGPELAPLGSAPPPPGAPVRVMIWAPQSTVATMAYPDLPWIATAFADLINTQGGVNGRPLVVINCDEGGEPAGATRCAEEAVSQRVLAVVGSYSAYPRAYLPVLERAGIPYIGGAAVGPEELTSAISFPITGGQSLLVLGAARLAAMQGCRRVSLVEQEGPGAGLERPARAGLAADGAVLTARTTLPGMPGPLTEQVATATRDSDCVLLAAGDQGTQRFLAAFQQQGGDQQLYTLGAAQNEGMAAQFPDLSPHTFRTDSLAPLVNGAWRRYRDAVARAPRGEQIDVGGTAQRRTWAAFEVFLQVARGLTRFDTPSMLAALRGSTAVDTGGLVPALDFTRNRPLPGLERLFNATVTYQRFDDGRFVELRPGFQDLAGVLSTPAGR